MDDSSFKSSGGLRRIVNAARYSLAGLRAAIRHEAAFRQELAVGVPLVLLAPFIAPDRWAALAMIASILLVLIIELLNSAIETVADAVSTDHHPLLGAPKDMGSAAVMPGSSAAAVTGLLLSGAELKGSLRR